VGSLLRESRLYAARKAALSGADRDRLEYEEERIAAGEEAYRATEHEGVLIHYFDYGLIAFRPESASSTELVALRLFDRM
jgi:hypothetical protein